MKKALLLALLSLVVGCSIQNRPPTTKEYYQQLQGTWLSGCFSFNGFYRVQSMEFSSFKVIFLEQVFSDSACSLPVVNYGLKANYAIGSSKDVILDQSIEFSTAISEVTATAVDAATVASYNFNGTCGYTDWVLNEPKNVSGKICEVTDKAQPKIGSNYLNLISIRQEINLYLGNDRCEIDDSCITYYGQKYPREYYPWVLIKL